jgi:hypothetical protein
MFNAVVVGVDGREGGRDALTLARTPPSDRQEEQSLRDRAGQRDAQGIAQPLVMSLMGKHGVQLVARQAGERRM